MQEDKYKKFKSMNGVEQIDSYTMIGFLESDQNIILRAETQRLLGAHAHEKNVVKRDRAEREEADRGYDMRPCKIRRM